MSNNITSCGLLAFKADRRMLRGTFVNKESHESFESIIFIDKAGEKTFCHFGKKLGNISNGEIARRKDELIVVTNLDTNRHYLAAQGNNWEEIEL